MTDIEHETYEHDVRKHAHRLWLAEGQPEGRADEDWRLAEEAVRSGAELATQEDADPLLVREP